MNTLSSIQLEYQYARINTAFPSSPPHWYNYQTDTLKTKVSTVCQFDNRNRTKTGAIYSIIKIYYISSPRRPRRFVHDNSLEKQEKDNSKLIDSHEEFSHLAVNNRILLRHQHLKSTTNKGDFKKKVILFF